LNDTSVIFLEEIQTDHSTEDPGNVREFNSYRGNVRYVTKSQEMSEKILSGEITSYSQLHGQFAKY